MNKGILIDRDGVINEDKGYVSSIKDFEFCDGVFEGLNEKGLFWTSSRKFEESELKRVFKFVIEI